jgi:type IV pilus modification protein PilV
MYIKNKTSTGFTLIELLIALVIATIGLLGLVKYQTTLIKHTVSGADRIVVSGLATQLLAEIRSNPKNILAYTQELPLFNCSDASTTNNMCTSGNSRIVNRPYAKCIIQARLCPTMTSASSNIEWDIGNMSLKCLADASELVVGCRSGTTRVLLTLAWFTSKPNRDGILRRVSQSITLRSRI